MTAVLLLVCCAAIKLRCEARCWITRVTGFGDGKGESLGFSLGFGTVRMGVGGGGLC